MNRMRGAALVLGAASVLLPGCGAGGGDGGGVAVAEPTPATGAAESPAPAASAPPYNPTVNPADFSTTIDNPYFPLEVGSVRVFEGVRDGRPQRAEITVTNETKEILGVTTVVVRDTVTSNGALVEETTDWYAQASDGAVWYFGEATAEFENGLITSTHGSWEAGVDGAQPGIVMPADPQPGNGYWQEYRPGEAEDRGQVLRREPSMQVPVGTFSDVVVTEDTDPLNPDRIDHKYYAPGVGTIRSERVRSGHHEESSLVSISRS